QKGWDFIFHFFFLNIQDASSILNNTFATTLFLQEKKLNWCSKIVPSAILQGKPEGQATYF
ncbi:MAG TPA: hypothetical protein PLJ90_03460, partial [Candidatus Cloacimonas sp.]|nr:hypothetical protein [Candidatus Cloacimonas sp.]